MIKSDKFTIGLVQMAMSADVDENLKKAGEFVREAAGKGAKYYLSAGNVSVAVFLPARRR